ncbi:hypothetical protein [Streptomyces flavofungini]|uniref:Uncharacterized protein n=1 Tax=Streptomyces flavofungini TaxID=68200 RepID=A0ABS0XDY9_9ACTN|nr:hypothetical protein [Streptomyces flavofungini]MBJ3811443.1 hypothetical protein [Streptomyces flavofungini]
MAPPAPPSALEPCLFEDPEAQRLLCYLVAEEGEKGERHFWVHDDQGEKVGAIRRIPPSRKPFKHTWRIDQPGHPEVVGRNQWASGDAMRIAERGAGRVLSEMVSVAASMGYDGSEEPGKKSRRLEWRSGDELVMVSESIKQIGIKADWLDRRLAFAFAVLGDI